jgi:UDP-N-acetylmuramoyl-tripeptide--D-alanyl-D-alanine ligase
MAAAVGGVLARTGGVATGIATDSRIVRAGDLFVAISADQKAVRESKTDGHDYVEKAVAAGAAGVMVRPGTSVPLEAFVIETPDTMRALGDLAAHHRRQFRGKVVAVTGSNGKSTTKEMIASILSVRWRTARNPGNFNNLLGLPLSILWMPDDTEALVLEAGMNRPGEIGRLTEIAAPDVGLITCVAPAHLEALGDVEAVARAKGEMLDRLGGGTAVLNADDQLVMRQASRPAGRLVTFGLTAEAWMRAERVVARTDGGCGFDLLVDGERRRMGIAMPGMHNVRNALAAAAAARVLGFTLEEIAQGLAACRPLAMRMEIVDLPSGVRVINDTYNANPGSVAASVEAIMLMVTRGKRAVLLGDMLELGPGSRDLHAETGRMMADAGVSLLVTVGAGAEVASQAYNQTAGARQRSSHYRSLEEAAGFLRKELRQGDLLLVKASRGMGLEKVVPLLGQAGGEG